MVRRERRWIAGATLLAVAVPAVLLWPGRPPAPIPVEPVRPIRLSPAPPMPAAPPFAGGQDAPGGGGPQLVGPQLVGIVGRLPDDAVALVRRPDGRTRSLRPGETVDGWTLAALSADAAAFTRGGERLRVALPAGE